MKIHVGRELYNREPKEIKRLLGLGKDDLGYGYSSKYVNLAKCSDEQLQSILELYGRNTDDKEIKRSWKDIANYIQLIGNKDKLKKIKATTVKHAYQLIIETMKKFCNHKHLYYQDEDVTVCYYIESMKYYPKVRHRDYTEPEYISINTCYREFGVVETEKFIFHVNDCVGNNVTDILLSNGLMIETVAFREDYLFYVEECEKYNSQVGKQMLARGYGNYKDIDGNDEDDEDDWRRSWRTAQDNICLDSNGEPTRVVIDVFRESEKKKNRKENHIPETWFWGQEENIKRNVDKLKIDDDEDDLEPSEVSIEDLMDVEVPIHPYIAVFDLKRHLRLKIHVGNLEEYKYNKSIRDNLVLPENCSKLIDVLLVERESHFRDIIRGKTGGTIILCQGPPGTGKTLTAEIYAEFMQRPLYTVQCAQLGVDAEELEKNLMKILSRGNRWNAVVLLDEADVYVHTRGDDLIQNAIVGVFLRVLEYHAGILFLTTNRGDLVDDAILSRCTARLPYGAPDIEQQHKIWRVLADANDIKIKNSTIRDIVSDHNKLSGRDIKNLLKLAALVAHDRKCDIDSELISELKIFKPTFDQLEDYKE